MVYHLHVCYLQDDKTLLIVAAELGKVEIMKVLISNGANINLQDKFGKSLIFSDWFPTYGISYRRYSDDRCISRELQECREGLSRSWCTSRCNQLAADTTLDVEIDETLREKDGHVKETHADDGCCVR